MILSAVFVGEWRSGSAAPACRLRRHIDGDPAVRYHRIVTPLHVVVMGVSGAGKSVIGELLAQKIAAAFLDADSLHPAANVAKMQAGVALDDSDRKPWIDAVGQRLATARGASLVVACSALKREYRDIIRTADPSVRFVLLDGSEELLAARLAGRTGHFMRSSLLRSQLQTLEPLQSDEPGLILDIAQTPEELACKAAAWLAGNAEHR